jgi:hypothetical protein
MAENCSVEPTAKLELGVTAIRERFAEAPICEVTGVLGIAETVAVVSVVVVVEAVVDKQDAVHRVKAAIKPVIRQ